MNKDSNEERHFAGATYNEQDRAGHHLRRDRGGVARRDGAAGRACGPDRADRSVEWGHRQPAGRRAGHDPGRVLIDVAVAIADGAVTISDVQALADQQGLHGPAGSVASTPTIWRVLAGVANAPGMLAAIRPAWADARDRSLVCSQRSAPNCCQPRLWVPMVGRLSGWRLILPVLLRLVLPGGVCRTVRLG